MSQAPRISIISPAYNAAKFYPGWLASIQQQVYDNVEVMLVDDGSSDELPQLIGTAPVYLRYIRQDNGGPAAARNAGLAACTGELIAFLDLDDRWTSDHLTRLSEALRGHQRAGIAQGLIRNLTYDFEGTAQFCSDIYRFINLGSGLFRRWVFDKAGLFDEGLKYAEDFDFMIRCWEQGIPKVDVDELSLLYHRHDGNMTNGKTSTDLGGVLIYKRHLDRMRAGRLDANIPRRQGIGYPEYMGRSGFSVDKGNREPIAALPASALHATVHR